VVTSCKKDQQGKGRQLYLIKLKEKGKKLNEIKQELSSDVRHFRIE